MERHIFWKPWDEPGFESLHYQPRADSIVADGLVLRDTSTGPFRFHYTIHCDPQYRVRKMMLHLLELQQDSLVLYADGQGRWTDQRGTALPAFDGCIDVDISATPFTNTLPINRLQLDPGKSRDIAVVYVAVPELWLTVDQQRYTCLDRHADGGTYRYLSIDSGFTADLPVDEDGLVIDYPALFRRIRAYPPMLT